MNLFEAILRYANFCRGETNPEKREEFLTQLLRPLSMDGFDRLRAAIEDCLNEKGQLIHGSEGDFMTMDFEVKDGISD